MLQYDVIVIGGGHAGIEASAMAARMGARTLLLTQNLETIGQMSCNPAIGGIAKGTVVREVDALGGVMARATDRACLQFRMLNRSKGPAVWSPRAQCDRGLYRRAARQILERHPGLDFAQGTVSDLRFDGSRIRGVVTREGRSFEAQAIVLTAGTFLKGEIHLGPSTRFPGGRAGDPATGEISQILAGQGLVAHRFKTGTPPRVDGRTVDLSRLRRQDSDPEGYRFSFLERAERPQQLPCYLTHLEAEGKEIIQRHLKESALYGGAISGRGPRYCPSIEDKVVKFAEAPRHQIFLEPEGLDTAEMYVNGLSTSLPPEVQLRILHTIPGLESVRMTRPGYAIEYDYFPPTQLTSSLEVRSIGGLFLAGQVNGTTGYEEAAGQGAVAGINAAALALGREPLTLQRSEAFVGVLVDDLVTRGVDEPYRLFTSRAEFRLVLRQDNALRRLLPVAERYGLLQEVERREALNQLEAQDRCRDEAGATSIGPGAVNNWLESEKLGAISEPTRLATLARRPGVSLYRLFQLAGLEPDPVACHWAEIEIRYEGYLAREGEQAARIARFERLEIPPDLSVAALTALSYEAREKLALRRPQTVGQASRIPGVSPSDLQALVYEVLRGRSRSSA